MTHHTISENIKLTKSDTLEARTASFESEELNLCIGVANGFMIRVGEDVLDGSNNWNFKMQVSDEAGGTFVDIPATDVSIVVDEVLQVGNNVDIEAKDKIVVINYVPLKEVKKGFGKVIATATGTVATPIDVIGIQSGLYIRPVVDLND